MLHFSSCLISTQGITESSKVGTFLGVRGKAMRVSPNSPITNAYRCGFKFKESASSNLAEVNVHVKTGRGRIFFW